MSPRRRRGFRRIALMLAALGAAGCGNSGSGGADLAMLPPGCGDGVIDPGEECDNGPANSDTAPDACRTSCRKAFCGDGVKDKGEPCDDGNAWGGDGCTPICTSESPPFEMEPNDDPKSANPWTGTAVHGALPPGDRDCYSLMLPTCGAVSAEVLAPCPTAAVITLFDPSGNAIATGPAATTRCAALDPASAAGARFVVAGNYSVCVEGFLGAAVPFYSLYINPVDPKTANPPFPPEEDEDGDGQPDRCDLDRDGDGVANSVDNCPDVPNGANDPPLAPTKDGFFRVWLGAGPFSGRSSNKDCRPTDAMLIGANDALAQPMLADITSAGEWRVLWSRDDRVDLLAPFGTVGAPREAYMTVYVKAATMRNLTLGVGPDDGARVWLNGMQLLDITACQGTNIDSSTAMATLQAGWNTLTIKVYDQGGGWGNYVRFLDGQGGKTPVTDLELSLAPGASWRSNQSDHDHDGIGDVCDPTP